MEGAKDRGGSRVQPGVARVEDVARGEAADA